ncbi:uncharacterized protein EV154DRAFT_555868 [Mucor mucedo]|uniref:uncharacterized protein n=1 Tax=Mucor mucedo TaxID=29922 RepID=UPI00221ED90F|nr:uncharacterized protein EV154DRAFT_555868 [Mucor mucedo]KAI7875534.1 hypothetical protein EV154DRAFT_555868 [Mucor mucedo]
MVETAQQSLKTSFLLLTCQTIVTLLPAGMKQVHMPLPDRKFVLLENGGFFCENLGNTNIGKWRADLLSSVGKFKLNSELFFVILLRV